MARAPWAFAVVACALLWAVHALAREPVRVEIDWSRVSDADVERCGLGRLRAGAIERLVSEGYAIVSRAEANGIRVSVASVAGGLQLEVSAEGAAREQRLTPSEPCDATFALEVISRIAELVAEVAAERMPSTEEPQAQRPELEPIADTNASPLVLSLDTTVRINDAAYVTLGGGLGVRAQVTDDVALGARAELTAAPVNDLLALEGLFALTAVWLAKDAWLGPCLELGPLVHYASSDARSVTELDALFGAGVLVRTGAFAGQLLASGRLRSLEHQRAGETLFDSGRFGASLRISVQLSGP